MNKELEKLFKQDNKRIDDSLSSKLNTKINKNIKHRPLVKDVILVVIALIGAGVFSWSLGLIIN